MEEAVNTPTLDQLTSAYIKIRDSRSQLKREYEANDKSLEEQMQLLSSRMLEICKHFGADSIRTEHGTVIRGVKTRYWTNDWDSMHGFIAEHRAFGLLEKRLHQSNMKEFLSENPELLPPGLNVESEYTVLVRRSNKEK